MDKRFILSLYRSYFKTCEFLKISARNLTLLKQPPIQEIGAMEKGLKFMMLTKRKTKFWSMVGILLIPLSLVAKPKGTDFSPDAATFSHPSVDNMIIIVDDQQAIINWYNFSIDSNEVVTFIQPDENSAVLNRVFSKEPSKLLGTLEANGKIYLINPNGIFIGNGALIDTNAFIASTLDVLESEFIKGGDIRFRGNSENKIVNLGTIRASGGDIALIGRYVENHGKLIAPNGMVALAVGKEILLKPNEKERVHICALSQNVSQKGTGIIQKGDIEALKIRLLADGNPYKLAIKHKGKLDALTTTTQNGEIYLVAEKGIVEVTGEVHAPGGEIHILGEKVALLENGFLDISSDPGGGEILFGGSFKGKNPDILNSEYSYVDKNATINVSSLVNGNAGQAIVWSDGLTSFHGVIIARGGDEGGNGGLVEISGKSRLNMTGTTDRTAPKGTPGELLTDPSTIIIKKGSLSSIDTSYIHGTYYPIKGKSILDETTLLAQLNSGPVTVTTSSTFDGEGDIIIDTNLDSTSSGGGYGTGHKLTFIADRDIHVRGNIQNSGRGDIVFNAGRDLRIDGTDRVARVGTQLGNTEIDVGRNLLLLGGAKGQAQIGFDNGFIKSNIHLKVGNDLILQSLGNFTLIGHTNTTPTSTGMDFQGNIRINHLGRNLVLLAGEGSHQFAQIGHAPHQVETHSYTSDVNASGDIHIPSIGGFVKLAAGKDKAGCYALIGHGGKQRSHNDSYQGNFIVHSDKDIQVYGGENSTPNNFAGIGFAQDFDGSATHVFHSDHISVKAKEGIYLNAGYGTNPAFIGAYTGNTPGTMDCSLHQLEVSSGTGIFLTANPNPKAMGNSVIGITGINGPAIANISIDANETLLLQGANQSSSTIVNYIGGSTEPGSIQIAANDFIVEGSDTNAYVSGFGPLSITTSNDLLLKKKVWIENKGGALTIASLGNIKMDPKSSIANLTKDPLSLSVSFHENEPRGQLIMEKGANLEGSNVTLYLTSKMDHTFAMAPHYTLVSDEVIPLVLNEEVKIVLPPEVPRTIFYKDKEFAYQNIQRSQLLVSGMLTAFHPMNEYLGWIERFQVAEKRNDQLYFQRMRSLSFNDPKNENIITFPKRVYAN
ncbi:MAG: filamentous hemagglutinin N-terminal domain-containing protein [Chlamydiia bacterium]|nr:filamentous hemagglutinin N-terminal domain-containing protein [Chlamydiia bacterium]